jgi:flagellin
LNTALERLSTGYRINSAKDDAAGLFIADQLRLVANALDQGSRNAQDGISAAQIAESSLSQIYDKLVAMYTKAQQAANDTNDANARASLQKDIEKLVDAINKIATTSEFNGIKLLDGSFQSKVVHFGPRADQTLEISIDSAKASDLGAAIVTAQRSNNTALLFYGTGSYTSADARRFDTGETLTINGVEVGAATFNNGDELDAYKLAQTINEKVTGVEAQATNVLTASADFNSISIGSDDTVTITIHSTASGATDQTITLSGGNTYTLEDIVSMINGVSSSTKVYARVDDTGKRLELYTTNGETFRLEFSISAGGTSGNTTIDLAKFGAQASVTIDDTASGTQNGYIHSIGILELKSSESLSIQGQGGLESEFGLTKGTYAISSLQTIDVTTETGAEKAMKIIDGAIKKVDALRSYLGSIQLNLQAIIDNNEFAATQTREAESRIRNVDFAKEIAEFTRQQTLMQSGMAMLAQANQLPQLVLQLLR